jgi:very-short-patch-repair endonuclease
MIEKRSGADAKIWAIRDRNIVPRNKLRARSMGRIPTDAERKLWWHLRYRLALADTHFRRQVHLGRYIVDFLSHNLKLAVELDAGQHAEQMFRDAKRTKFLETQGYRVLRFWNNEVLQNIDGVLELIQSAILATPTPAPAHKGEGKRNTNA